MHVKKNVSSEYWEIVSLPTRNMWDRWGNRSFMLICYTLNISKKQSKISQMGRRDWLWAFLLLAFGAECSSKSAWSTYLDQNSSELASRESRMGNSVTGKIIPDQELRSTEYFSSSAKGGMSLVQICESGKGREDFMKNLVDHLKSVLKSNEPFKMEDDIRQVRPAFPLVRDNVSSPSLMMSGRHGIKVVSGRMAPIMPRSIRSFEIPEIRFLYPGAATVRWPTVRSFEFLPQTRTSGGLLR